MLPNGDIDYDFNFHQIEQIYMHEVYNNLPLIIHIPIIFYNFHKKLYKKTIF